MVTRKKLDMDSQKHVVCPKCGKDLVLSKPDGSPLLDGYVQMECPSCSDKVRYTVLRSSIPDTTLNIANVQKSNTHNKLNSFLLAFIIICCILGIASVMGWISLPNLLPHGSGNIVGSWVSGDTTLTFSSNGAYTETLGGQVFDTGTYKSSGGQMTMTSRFGRSSTASYNVSGNTLTGFIDGYGNHVTYTRLSP